jgi:hypothetical protein
MVFGLSTDDGTLHVFADVDAAVSYAEGVDVEDGGWPFFSDGGSRLEPIFATPNRRGRFGVESGQYTLRPADDDGHLLDHIHNASGVDGPAPLNTVSAITERLTPRSPSGGV